MKNSEQMMNIGWASMMRVRRAMRVNFDFSAYGGMCGYHFENFFVPNTIECENDLKIQELFLKRINWLLDEGILKKS